MNTHFFKRTAPANKYSQSLHLVYAACLTFLAGCASTPVVTTQITQHAACASSPATLKTAQLTADPKNQFVIDADTHCFVNPQGKTTAGILVPLPEFHPGYYIRVSSLAGAGSILPLRIETLDNQYQVRRTLDGEKIFYRGAALTGDIFFNPADSADRFLLISAEPELIGQSTEQTVLASQTATVATGVIFFSYTSGTESLVSRTYTYNGELELSVGSHPGY